MDLWIDPERRNRLLTAPVLKRLFILDLIVKDPVLCHLLACNAPDAEVLATVNKMMRLPQVTEDAVQAVRLPVYVHITSSRVLIRSTFVSS